MERSSCRSRAIAVTRGDLIALLDADDTWLPDNFALQVAIFQSDPRTSLVCGKTRGFRAGRIGGTAGGFLGRALVPDMPMCDLLQGKAEPMPLAWLRTDVSGAVGGFDPTPWPQGCEDYDLWLRVTDRHGVSFVDEVLALYRVHPDQTSADPEAMLRRTYRVRQRFVANNSAVLAGAPDDWVWVALYGGPEEFIRSALRDYAFGDALAWWLRILFQRPPRFLLRRAFLARLVLRRLCKIAKLELHRASAQEMLPSMALDALGRPCSAT